MGEGNAEIFINSFVDWQDGEKEDDGSHGFVYNETLMYGQHMRTILSQFARNEALNNKIINTDHRSEDRTKPEDVTCCKRSQHGCCKHSSSELSWNCRPLIEDWLFLTLLGALVAIISFGMDVVIDKIHTARKFMIGELEDFPVVQYFVWISFFLTLTCFAAGFTHFVGPTAIGSGIPEVKTIIRGVLLKEYLTFQTLIAKMVGLTACLGSGLPLGKEGPFVHIASISASLLSKLFPTLRCSADNNGLRMTDILAPACAVGVACTFAAPIGGLLFSIEVTATYFAVKNYWRSFYAASCGAMMFRLFAIWFKEEETLTALFKTNLPKDVPFSAIEMVAFSFLGVCCGVLGALFVFVHKHTVLFIRRQNKLKEFLQNVRLLYPALVAFVIATILFPPGLGQYMAGQLTNHDAMNDLLNNLTWSTIVPESVEEDNIVKNWSGPHGNILVTLVIFTSMRFWMSAVASTCPVPCGIFIPAFTMGAAIGRLMGEVMPVCFPTGLGGTVVVPGGYAIVGASAFASAVTHTVSTVVIVFELTGHIGHILPCALAVMIAKAVANLFQPSIYDVIIQMKQLPFLPDSIDATDVTGDVVDAKDDWSRSGADVCTFKSVHRITAEHFMIRNVQFLTTSSKCTDAICFLRSHPFKAIPIVDAKNTMILIGGMTRKDLRRLIKSFLLTVCKTFEHLSNKDTETTENTKPVWNRTIDFAEFGIDRAPYQVVEGTSLYKVHQMFSLLGLHHVYVTRNGRLTGVITITELRNAIQGETDQKSR